MKRSLVLVGIGVVMLLLVPCQVFAANPTVHYFDCKQCHKANASVTSLATANICLQCHEGGSSFSDATPGQAPTLDGLTDGKFFAADASNLFNNNTVTGTAAKRGLSHMWSSPDLNLAAGARPPATSYAGFYSRYNSSLGRVSCTRCHNPHGEADMLTGNPMGNQKLLIRDSSLANAPMSAEKMCQVCHIDFAKTVGSPYNTHPVVANYAAVQTAKPTQYWGTAQIAAVWGSSKAQLVNNGVGCTSCHGVHYVDSDSSSADGVDNRQGFAEVPTFGNMDGNLLRADGPLRWATTRHTPVGADTFRGTADDGAPGTAQLRSRLCQTCHTYAMHGKSTGTATVGCLECHNAHDYDNPNAFGLRDVSATVLPHRVRGTTQASGAWATISFTWATRTYTQSAFDRSKWTDGVEGTALGYCERCHGDVEDTNVNGGLGNKEIEHRVGAINPCTACHKHNDPATANKHSFNIDANASTCGQCHGFPPYKNAPGDRDSGGTDGGYARNEVDWPSAQYDYAGRSYFKDETQTGHKTHAGAELSINPGTWYFVGGTGIENCMPCHGNNAGQGGGGHRIAPTTDADTFRNINFNQYGTGNGQYTPTFNTTTNKCSATYCHSAGGPRTGDGPTRNYAVWATTPAWVGNGTTDGFNSIQNKGADRCGYCHGYTEATMGAGQKNNSQAHLLHLNKGYGCEVCHFHTATSNTVLTSAAYDGRAGGEHINLIADVDYKTSGTPLSVAMATNLSGVNYNAATGTCSIYCHDPQDTGVTADWDSAANMQCDSCHKGLLTDTSADGGLGPITSGSHLRHVSDATGPKLGCDECHGAGSSTGSHSGMLDGAVVVVAGVCNTCHAVDAGETVPVWGNPGTGGCVACHTGATTTPGGLFTTSAAPAFPNFLTTGHGKPSGTYAATNLPAANKACLDCHATASANHYDNIAGNDDVLLGGFTCEGCHDGTPATAVQTHSNTNPAYTGQKRTDFTKLCLACHTPHGSANLAMIAPVKTDFGGTVSFLTWGTSGTPIANDNSFDESGDASNLDDICATCHTAVTHNNRAMTGTHNEGKTCVGCHSHNGANGGFMPTGGNACNDCHGNPPATGAHAKHTTVTTHDLGEDRTDCAVCHVGADTYTMAPGGNHQANGVNVNPAITWSTSGTVSPSDDTCTTACHNSNAGDGAWGDANGLNCNSCHYYSATPTSAGNVTSGASELVGAMAHNKHFDKSIACSACHGIENSGNPIVGPLTHVFGTTAGGDEGTKFTGMAAALQDEADVVRASMTFNDAPNTCANNGGGLALGCHATGTPDWDNTIPATGCTQCHTDTSTATVNPTSSLHAVVPTVSGKQHSTGFTYNAGANTADCTTCHTTTPSSAHQNGVLNQTIGAAGNTAINFAAGFVYTDAVTPTCAVSTTGCHTRGNGWSYKWGTSSAQTNGTECNGCHGMWAAWNTGVINHRSGSEAETVHGTGAVYKCRDCHGLESASGYPFTSTTNDWKPTEAGTTLHGDGLININTAGTTGFTRTTFGGCTGCHSANDGAAAGQHGFAISTWTWASVTGDAISTSCSSCHGGGTAGPNQSNYWPDGANTLGDNGTADNRGEHAEHITIMASQVMGQNITQLLTNNAGVGPNPWATSSSDAKQRELCAYCHNTPGTDGDHGVTYPADVNSMYTLWNKTLDNGVYTSATGSCATVDCHNNKTTPAAYNWYAGGANTCLICHSDITVDITHPEHTGGGFGRTIDCNSCHRTAAETVTWGTGGTAPATNHINGAFTVSSNQVAFTYSGFTYPSVKGTCGINTCHNDGKLTMGTAYSSGAPLGAYTWGSALTDCTACHNNPNTTGNGGARHTKHMANTAYVPGGCTDCHPAGTVATHIDGTINATSAKQSVYTAGTGTCTNTCHTVTDNAGDWTDTNTLNCTTCHQAGSYIGGSGSGYMGTSGLHWATVAVRHGGSLAPAAASACINCHAASPTSVATNHINGTLQNATAITYAWNANVITYVPATGCMAGIACHTDGGDWRRRWTGFTDAKAGTGNPGDAVCQNCHGDQTGWRWNEANASTTDHTDTNANATDNVTTSHGTCQVCHGWGDAGYIKNWGTGQHGDGLITMNGPVGTGSGYNNLNGGCDSQGCHLNDASHQLNTNSGWTANFGNYGAGSCSSCHGGGTAQAASTFNYWPDGAAYPDTAERHSIHITRLAAQLGYTLGSLTDAQQKHMCAYCHNDATGVGGAGHSTDSVPTGIADLGAFNPQWDTANPPTTTDTGASFTTADDSCVSIDCHNNVTAPAGTYGWRNASTSACVMCHSNITVEAAHTAHTAAGMGINITCNSCHRTAAETIAWGTPGTAPATGHINGAFTVTSNQVAFTYSGFTYPSVKGTCGTNFCHNDGKNGTPRTTGAAYTWGSTIAGCAACHGDATATLTTQSHAVHTGSTIQTMTCASCHAAATVTSHIDGNITWGTTVPFTYGGDVAVTGTTFGGCGTNNCHNNGKNAAPRTAAYTWGSAIGTTCGECHGDTAATLTSESHAPHLNAAATYGKTIACNDCHTAATDLANHVNATINFTGMTYGGDVAITGTTFGSCGTNACHENGLGAAPVTTVYTWGTTLTGCSFCHNSAAMTTGSHTTHVGTANAWGPYPAGSTNCGECHLSNNNNTSMAGMTAHMNGANDFAGTTTLAATTSCNACHGGATPATTAKSYWATATRVTCESCHGDFTLALIGGKTAPNNAGVSYDTYGHNKVTNSAFGGKACADCHNTTAAGHLDTITGDDKRMKVVNSQTWATANNTFCASACHGGSAENAHYANTQTGGGASDDGIYCMTCHNPHGQNGNQDAMIRSTIAGRTVAGFTDKTLRASYANASFNGVCQVCHDTNGEVPYFNRSAFVTGHQGGVDVCTTCHSHSSTTAFAFSGGGCGSCHGYPPVQRTTDAGAPYVNAKVEDYQGGGRAHAIPGHLPTTITQADGWTPCAPCHDVNDHNMGLGVGNLGTQRSNSGTWGSAATRYPRVRMDVAYSKWGTAFYVMGTANTTSGMGYCSSTSCHFSESPKWDCLPADTTNDPSSN